MIVDCHYHLNETLVPTDALLRAMDEKGIDKIALMANMTGPIPHIKPGLEKVGRLLLTHAIFRSIGQNVQKFTPDGNVVVPGGCIAIIQDPDNQGVFDTVSKHPDKFLGWVFVSRYFKPRQNWNATEKVFIWNP